MISRDTSGATSFLLQLGPFGGGYVHGWEIRLWSVAYLVLIGAAALAAFARREPLARLSDPELAGRRDERQRDEPEHRDDDEPDPPVAGQPEREPEQRRADDHDEACGAVDHARRPRRARPAARAPRP